jgi:hypothetical protein
LSDGQDLGDGTISDITFTSQSGKTYPSNSTFGVTVTERIVLDENSPFELTKTTVPKNILVKRTLKPNKWCTICLPFALNEAQLKSAFGDDVKIAEFTGCTYNETEGITLDFTSIDIAVGIEACTPYLIKVSAEKSQFNVDGVKITKSPISSDQEFNYGIGTGSGSMSGIFSLTKMQENDLFLQDEAFYYAVAGQTIKGFRAIFNFYDEDGQPYVQKAASRDMFFVDGKPINDATGISSKRYITENKRVYSVTGRFMGENVDMKSLPKGIYIVDGVKIVNE